MVVTMATVGYGDYIPKTHVGRIIAVFGMLVGTTIVAILTASVSSNLTMNANDTSAARFLEEVRWGEQTHIAAARVIQRWWRSKDRTVKDSKVTAACIKLQQIGRAKQQWEVTEPHMGRQLTIVVERLKELQENVTAATAKIAATLKLREDKLTASKRSANAPGARLVECPRCLLEFRAKIKDEDGDLIPSDRAALAGAKSDSVDTTQLLQQVMTAVAMFEQTQKTQIKNIHHELISIHGLASETEARKKLEAKKEQLKEEWGGLEPDEDWMKKEGLI